MRSYKNLSDHDFELLIADLLRAETGHRYEVFARGADGGIDLRYSDEDGYLEVVQCKHMEGSTYAQLRAATKQEANKLQELSHAPTKYRFFTTRSISAANKAELRSILSPWISSESDVVGPEDLEGILDGNAAVERRHIKLWLTSAAQLDVGVNAAVWTRSSQMLDEINEALPRFVDTGVYEQANQRLYSERALVLSGPPGIGKTSIARMLAAEAVANGFEPIEVSADIEEANAVFDSSSRQVFLYDDFLGATFLQDRLSKNEDKRLAGFIRRCRRSDNSLFVLTTREHILKQATDWYDELERADLPLRRLLIELKSYSRRERALILYNHLYQSKNLAYSAKTSVVDNGGYLRIVDHPNYNPRIIEHVTANFVPVDVNDSFLKHAIRNLDEPERIWEQAFLHQLDHDCRDVVLLLSTMPSPITVEELEAAFHALASTRGKIVQHGAVRNALRILDDSFTRSSNRRQRETEVAVANPSVSDFAGLWLRNHPIEAIGLLDGALHFEQLDWLHSQAIAQTFGREKLMLLASMRAAATRLFDSTPLGWSFSAQSTRWYSSYLRNMTPEGRMLFICQTVVDEAGSSLDEPFNAWLKRTLENIGDRWAAERSSNLEIVIELVSALHDRGLLSTRLEDDARAAIISARTRGEWEAVASMIEDEPGLLGLSVSMATPHYDHWVKKHLINDLDDIEDIDALNELEAVAERLGVPFDSWAWIEAREAIENRPEPENEPERPRVATTTAPEASDSELRNIFEHLRESQ